MGTVSLPQTKPFNIYVIFANDCCRPLVYPAVGRDKATVDFDDLKRLDEGEWLNDNLIMFYLKYVQRLCRFHRLTIEN